MKQPQVPNRLAPVNRSGTPHARFYGISSCFVKGFLCLLTENDMLQPIDLEGFLSRFPTHAREQVAEDLATLFSQHLQAVAKAARKARLQVQDLALLAEIANSSAAGLSPPMATLARIVGITPKQGWDAQARLVRAGLITSDQERSSSEPTPAVRHPTLEGLALLEGRAGEAAPEIEQAPRKTVADHIQVDERQLAAADLEPGQAVSLIEALCDLASEDLIAAGDKVVDLLTWAVWSGLAGATSYRAHSVTDRARYLAALIRSGRFAKPFSLTASKASQLKAAFSLSLPNAVH